MATVTTTVFAFFSMIPLADAVLTVQENGAIVEAPRVRQVEAAGDMPAHVRVVFDVPQGNAISIRQERARTIGHAEFIKAAQRGMVAAASYGLGVDTRASQLIPFVPGSAGLTPAALYALTPTLRQTGNDLFEIVARSGPGQLHVIQQLQPERAINGLMPWTLVKAGQVKLENFLATALDGDDGVVAYHGGYDPASEDLWATFSGVRQVEVCLSPDCLLSREELERRAVNMITAGILEGFQQAQARHLGELGQVIQLTQEVQTEQVNHLGALAQLGESAAALQVSQIGQVGKITQLLQLAQTMQARVLGHAIQHAARAGAPNLGELAGLQLESAAAGSAASSSTAVATTPTGASEKRGEKEGDGDANDA